MTDLARSLDFSSAVMGRSLASEALDAVKDENMHYKNIVSNHFSKNVK